MKYFQIVAPRRGLKCPNPINFLLILKTRMLAYLMLPFYIRGADHAKG
jgi:hypothetical protein